MPVTFDTRLRMPEDVLLSELDGEAVILNVKTESYFGLDDVGARMLAAVTSAESVQEAYDGLAGEYDVDPGRLRNDLAQLLDNLIEHGLLESEPKPTIGGAGSR
jgi:hypothetical protein